MDAPDEPLQDSFVVRAYERLRHSDWGALDVALAHPIRGKLIQGLARNLRRATVSPQPIEPAKQPGKTPPPTPPRALLDRKRLASGEKEDDY